MIPASVGVEQYATDRHQTHCPREHQVEADPRLHLHQVTLIIKTPVGLSSWHWLRRNSHELMEMDLCQPEGIEASTDVLAPLWVIFEVLFGLVHNSRDVLHFVEEMR